MQDVVMTIELRGEKPVKIGSCCGMEEANAIVALVQGYEANAYREYVIRL
jgi:hypothetical protein